MTQDKMESVQFNEPASVRWLTQGFKTRVLEKSSQQAFWSHSSHQNTLRHKIEWQWKNLDFARSTSPKNLYLFIVKAQMPEPCYLDDWNGLSFMIFGMRSGHLIWKDYHKILNVCSEGQLNFYLLVKICHISRDCNF